MHSYRKPTILAHRKFLRETDPFPQEKEIIDVQKQFMMAKEPMATQSMSFGNELSSFIKPQVYQSEIAQSFENLTKLYVVVGKIPLISHQQGIIQTALEVVHLPSTFIQNESTFTEFKNMDQIYKQVCIVSIDHDNSRTQAEDLEVQSARHLQVLDSGLWDMSKDKLLTHTTQNLSSEAFIKVNVYQNYYKTLAEVIPELADLDA